MSEPSPTFRPEVDPDKPQPSEVPETVENPGVDPNAVQVDKDVDPFTEDASGVSGRPDDWPEDQGFIVYTDDEGKSHRVTVSQYLAESH